MGSHLSAALQKLLLPHFKFLFLFFQIVSNYFQALPSM